MSQSYTQQEVRERAAMILAMPTGIRYGVINEFHNMAAGETEYGLRAKYYPGKPDSFFKEVLLIVEGGGQ